MKNIPQVLHLFWYRNKPLSFLRYLTAKSFAEVNPNWKIKVYYTSETTIFDDPWPSEEIRIEIPDYFEKLREIPNTDLIPVEPNKGMGPVHFSDLFRIEILKQEGGLWSDFDILYLKSMETLDFPEKEVYLCYHYGYHSIGFMMAVKNSSVFKVLSNSVKKNFKSEQYQCIGSFLYNEFIDIECDSIYNMPFHHVYPYKPSDISDFFEKDKKFCSDTIGVHWFAGARVAAPVEDQIVSFNRIKDYPYQDSAVVRILKDCEVKYGCTASL